MLPLSISICASAQEHEVHVNEVINIGVDRPGDKGDPTGNKGGNGGNSASGQVSQKAKDSAKAIIDANTAFPGRFTQPQRDAIIRQLDTEIAMAKGPSREADRKFYEGERAKFLPGGEFNKTPIKNFIEENGLNKGPGGYMMPVNRKPPR